MISGIIGILLIGIIIEAIYEIRNSKLKNSKPVEDKEKIEKLKKFLSKHRVERVGC